MRGSMQSPTVQLGCTHCAALLLCKLGRQGACPGQAAMQMSRPARCPVLLCGSCLVHSAAPCTPKEDAGSSVSDPSTRGHVRLQVTDIDARLHSACQGCASLRLAIA